MKTVELIQQPYLSDGFYTASGYLSGEDPADETGPTVFVTWACKDGWEEMDDESHRCDWDNPSSVTHYSLGDLTGEVEINEA